MPDPFVITLRRPVGPKGREIAELRLREPTTGEVMLASRQTGRSLALSLLAQVTRADAAALEALPGRVCDQALAHLMTFIEPILNPDADPDPDADLPEELVIDLAETLQIGTTWVSQVTLREPTLGELIKGERYDGMQRTLVVVALASGLPRAVVELMPISAFAKAAAFVRGFTDAAPSNGGAPSGG